MSTQCTEELRALLSSGWRLVAFETFEEDRALQVLQRLVQAGDQELSVWSAARGCDPDGAGAGSLDAGIIALSQRTQPGVFALLDAHRWLDDPLAVRRLRDWIPQLTARKQAAVLLAPVLELPDELARDTARVSLPLPSHSELQNVFQRLLEKNHGSEADTSLLDDAVRGALGLTAGEAQRVFRRACRTADGLNTAAIDEIVRDKRRALRRAPALAFHEASVDLAEVGGLGELKSWLAERRRAFTEEARRFGLPVPRGLLLLGVQGCGKSLSAKAVAQEWRFPLLRLDLAAAFGSGRHAPELAMREATQIAESLAPAVLWIDEIEKGFAASAADPSANRVFGSFLTWLSEKQAPVFVVATANDVAALPPELLRRGRFDELFFVDLPTAKERQEILSIHLRKRGRDPSHYRVVELAEEAERLTGAELEQAVTAALYTAFAENRELDDDDLANAIGETVPLYDTYEERIKELRDWARDRARSASVDAKMVDLFAGG
ncbi:MAG: AAA family ATPase [Deltaproteobacteria bacterium]|nr:AAA family ATPase [Deltaproteobacteria bacterium]MBW2362628.1 AAA family ATPase [Deltaproteobacteria bacterium]